MFIFSFEKIIVIAIIPLGDLLVSLAFPVRQSFVMVNFPSEKLFLRVVLALTLYIY